MESLDVVKSNLSDLNYSFGRTITTIEGWIGTLGLMYFTPGSLGATILGLCVGDLFTGTILSRKITRLLKEGYDPKAFPELTALIISGKKTPFTWKKWGHWIEKMLVVFGCMAGGEWFKLYLVKNPWSAEGGNFAIGVMYFVLMFTNFRSIVRNTALVTENEMLLSFWKWLGSDHGVPTLSFLQQHSTTTSTSVTVVETATTIESETKPNEHP